MTRSTAEIAHYRAFYDEPASDGRPLLLVVGNCQAESLRLLLESSEVATVRMPAVHEMDAADTACLHRWVGRCDALISQPVSPDYRGLPLGHEQLADLLPRGAVTALVPSVRFSGLYPFHVVVHPPGLVAYHDVRTLVGAGWSQLGEPEPRQPAMTAEMVRAVAQESLDQLRSREDKHGTLPVHDLFAHPRFAMMRTVNHPGNAVLEPLAWRLQQALGLPGPTPTTSVPLLDSVHAPRLAVVARAFDLDESPTSYWRLASGPVALHDVELAHREWYARRPDVLLRALDRVGPLCELLGLHRPVLAAGGDVVVHEERR